MKNEGRKWKIKCPGGFTTHICYVVGPQNNLRLGPSVVSPRHQWSKQDCNSKTGNL